MVIRIPKCQWSNVLVAVPLILAVAGCRMVKTTTKLPARAVSTITPEKKADSATDPVELQLQLQRFTDDFTTRSGEALDEYVLRVGTEAAHVEAIRIKLSSGSALVSIASGPNPNVNLLDLVSVTVLTRMTIEEYWMKTTNGPAFQPWLAVSRELETNVWRLAARVLKPAQKEELRQAITLWYSQNPGARSAFFARPAEFASMVKATQEKGAGLSSLLSLVSLDPTSGLDPAVREVTRTRLFAERAMFTMQRMPFLLRLQTELLVHELARQPQVQLALTNTARLSDSADRISRAAESVSQTAAQLPDRLTAERKAIQETLETQEGRLRELSAEVSRTLAAGEKMSTSLNITITNFDALMKRFGVGEPSTNAAPSSNSPPFNVLDYGTVAGQVSGMARELNTLITSVNQSTPQLASLSQQAGADAHRLIDRSFRLALVLIGVLLSGSMLAALAYRILANKLTARGRLSSCPNPP